MLIKRGAEASLYLEEWHGQKVILKKRHSKRYRVPALDKQIRVQRTKHESQILHKAKVAGVPTPIIFMVNLEEETIIMGFVEGELVKKVLSEITCEDRNVLCLQIGELIGKLHNNGIIHSDLTTSNMILTPSGKVVLIDFGLSEQIRELEAYGVDLHLLHTTFKSTHFTYADECFESVMRGYSRVIGKKVAEAVLKRISEIEKRGRYVSDR